MIPNRLEDAAGMDWEGTARMEIVRLTSADPAVGIIVLGCGGPFSVSERIGLTADRDSILD